ncbi:MAG TPA: DUF4404 family protein [Psychromonas hadalis]|nr:DUF4404 family protein [Psychromonas hadalis]
MPIEKVKLELEKLTGVLSEDLIADECTASELKIVHDQFQNAILSADPSIMIKDEKLIDQLAFFEETHPVVGKAIKDFLNALSSMGI